MLRSGSRREDVANLQRLLKLKGFDPGEVDGAFGPVTAAALEEFQAAAGLDVDGPKSEAALKDWAPAPVRSPAKPPRSRRTFPAASDPGQTRSRRLPPGSAAASGPVVRSRR